ncbi:putative permease [Pseudomonas asplenii]|uniref:Probable membrane transporter protein n=2 Tax=Pseudomonas TaxID=286 RepID=A0A0M9GD20_9PSED|nr:putative permease [Pseudomonas fuscovaginae]KPA95596.1 putative permease [Pseudomonas fuscovaginae]
MLRACFGRLAQGLLMDVGNFGFVVAGLVVGFIVGMTGVGGGSLMTPILLWFGINPATAVGTDLLYAAITKSGGVLVHKRNDNIDWKITGWLTLGSVPAVLLTLWFLSSLNEAPDELNRIIKQALGVVLLLTALAVLFKKALLRFAHQRGVDHSRISAPKLNGLTVLTGLVLGTMVALTSIGAGALGTVALFILYPFLPTRRLVGTEIAHAVPLTLVAGLGHAGMGNMNWELLGFLLMGSLPGIYLGSHLAGRVADGFLRPFLALMLFTIGYKLVF